MRCLAEIRPAAQRIEQEAFPFTKREGNQRKKKNMKSLFAESNRRRRALTLAPPTGNKATPGVVSHSAVGAASQDNQQKRQKSPEVAPPARFEQVSFQRFFPTATRVCVAGSFNGWQPSATPMRRFGFGTGRWTVDLPLKPGRYEYRLVVDGNWTDDPLGQTFVPNPFGTRNCVLLVNASKGSEGVRTSSELSTAGSNGKQAVLELNMGNLFYKDTGCGTRVPSHEQIEQLAYNLYLRRGKKTGHALADWLAAEKRLRALIAEE